MEGVEKGEAFALAKPFSDQLKARARRSSTNYLIPLAGKEISTLILGSGNEATAQWLLCRQECSDALAKALAGKKLYEGVYGRRHQKNYQRHC